MNGSAGRAILQFLRSSIGRKDLTTGKSSLELVTGGAASAVLSACFWLLLAFKATFAAQKRLVDA